MSDINKLVEQNKFIRVDAEGEHEENLVEFCKNDVKDILQSLNRDPEKLINLYNRTQNKKFLNDIGLALAFQFFYNESNKRIDELLRTPKEEIIDTEKWNALVIEKESLKEQLATSNAACADMEKLIHNDLEEIEKLKNENDKLKSDYTVLNDEYLNNENILGETLAANKELVESNKHLSEQNNDLNLKIDECEAKLKIQENVSESHEALKMTYAELQYKYEELTKKDETIITEKNKLENENAKLKETEEYYETLKNKFKDLHADYEKNIKELDHYKNIVSTLEKEIFETKEALNNAENIIATINTAVNSHIETAASKPLKENKNHRIGEEQVTGHNIGI